MGPSSKKRENTKNTTPDTLSSSSSLEDESLPCKTTQIFIGVPGPGHGGYINNGVTDDTQEDWWTKYCSDGRARRPITNTLPYSFQGRGLQQTQPQIVYLPTYHEGCRKARKHVSNCSCLGNGKNGEDEKKMKKGEEPMTPDQQYLTFLQGYALAAAVLLGPPPRQNHPEQ